MTTVCTGARMLSVAAAVAGCTSFGSSADATDGGADASASDTSSATSCNDVLTRDPSRRGHDGTYAIAIGVVDCDMTTDGGGWTLVGRSGTLAPSDATFGWTSATGDLASTDVPYSLDVAKTKLAFREVLVSALDRSHAYKLAVSDAVVAMHASDLVETGGALPVTGDCTPAAGAGPAMLKYFGVTSRTDAFFFRDVSGTDQIRGLLPKGFDLSYKDDCDRGGDLDGVAGLIRVR